MVRVERHDTITDDGWRIALHRYAVPHRDVLSEEAPRRRFPVVCCHGLGANRVAFDIDPEVSLARHIAARGYEVFLVDLRGHGASERGPYGWAFDDYVTHDVPAILKAVGPAHWIGHSMGGILGLAYLARGGDQMASVITVGSALDYSGSGSGFRRLLPLRRVLEGLPSIPVGHIARLSAPLMGRIANPYERFNVWSSNCDLRLFRRICERGFHAVSTPVMAQLASAILPGGLRSLDGDPYVDKLASVATRVLALAGSRDAQCPESAVALTVAALGERGAMRVFGRDHGEQDHYGHFDLLMGLRVRQEVFPHIDAWLDDNDSVRTAE